MTTIFEQIKRLDSGCVMYMLSRETGECVIVDPLLDIDFIVNEAKKEGHDRITRVIDTHTHADHISGARNLVRMFNLSGIYMHANSGRSVQHGQTLKLGNVELRFIYTPGNTYDHVCI